MKTQPEGYLARPTSGQGAPILVLHAWWGLNETIRAFCRRLADAGFVAFAPDLYHGQIAETIPDAEKLGRALDEKTEQAQADIAAATDFLLNESGQGDGGLTVIGFSLGAAYALDLAAAAPEQVHSVVLFYGVGPADFAQAQARFLGHFASEDPYEPQENVEWLANALRTAGRPATFYTYSNTGHWFFESDRADAYNQAAADLAWERTLAFLTK